MRRAGLIVGALAASVGCGHPARPAAVAVAAPVRAATVGDALLPRLPAGAELVVEIDLARLRGNPAVGPLVTALVDGDAPIAPGLGPVGPVSLAGADAVVLAAYRIGTPAASTVTLVRGGARPATAIALDAQLWALADEGAVAELMAVTPEHSVAADAALMVVRAAAMPAAAEGAAVRIAARVDGAAQRGLGQALEVAAPPRAISVWLDVADDLAVVAWIDGAGPGLLARWRDRWAVSAQARALDVAAPLADAPVVARDGGQRLTVVIGPRRLARAVARWQAVREVSP